MAIPTMSAVGPGEAPQLALRRTDQGDLVVLAYTDLKILVESFGEQQSLVARHEDDLQKVILGSGATKIVLNSQISSETSPEKNDGA